jgi:hypothetical protein
MKNTLLLLERCFILVMTCSCGKQETTVVPFCGEYKVLQEEASGPNSEMQSREEVMQDMKAYEFSVFNNVEITGADLESMTNEELSVLLRQAQYCQAMIDADIDSMREIVSEDMAFTHMSGMQQTREESFADVADGSLNYFTIGISNPVIEVDSDTASITYTSALNANAYGTRGTYRIKGTHHYEKRDSAWIAVNG